MGKDIYDKYPQARVFQNIADEVFGTNLTGLRFKGPKDQLNLTENAQPIIYTDSFATMFLGRQNHLDPYASSPKFIAGHSFGQLATITATGCLGNYLTDPEQVFRNGIQLVKARVEATKAACLANPGGMMAIETHEKYILRLSPRGQRVSLDKILPAFGLSLSVVNSDEQVVVGGPDQSLSVFSELLHRQSNPPKTTRLRIEGAFHTPLMQSASEEFAPTVRNLVIYPPEFPVMSNITAKPLTTTEQIQNELIQGLTKTVRWKDTMSYLDSHGMNNSIEVGTNILSKFTPQLGGEIVAVAAAGVAAYVVWRRRQ